MPAAYTRDLRERLLRATDAGLRDAEIAHTTGVRVRSLARWRASVRAGASSRCSRRKRRSAFGSSGQNGSCDGYRRRSAGCGGGTLICCRIQLDEEPQRVGLRRSVSLPSRDPGA
jgi:hypothetical protein